MKLWRTHAMGIESLWLCMHLDLKGLTNKTLKSMDGMEAYIKKNTLSYCKDIRHMMCKNISTDKHSLYINPNGICNKCQMIKDKRYERRTKRNI